MSESKTDQIGIIGGRLGGQVMLFEKNAWLGGKAAVLEQGGFRFDMGPTILTPPSVLTRIFAEAERTLSDYLDLVPLDQAGCGSTIRQQRKADAWIETT